MLATALAAGSFTVARLLTDSTAVLLGEKASVFSAATFDHCRRPSTLPPPFDATGTVVTCTGGPQRPPVGRDLLGIDPKTFERINWRDDASARRYTT